MFSIGTFSQKNAALGSENNEKESSAQGQGSIKTSFFSRKMEWFSGDGVRSSSRKSSVIAASSFLSSSSTDTESTSFSERSISVVSSYSQQKIEQDGTLFSAADFQKSMKPSFLSSSLYKNVLQRLASYHKESKALSKGEKQDRLTSLQKTTERYYQEQIEKRDQLSSPSSTKGAIVKNMKATQALLNGIALEKQKILAEDSYYQSQNELGPEDTTASGGMATLSVILYFKKPSLEDDGEMSRDTVAGYFKSVGSERMASNVAKELGIPEISTAIANLSGRAVASYEVSKLLGFSDPASEETNLVPETSFACYNEQYGSLQLRAEGCQLIMEETQEQFIPNDEKSRHQVVVDIARGGLRLEPGERLEIRSTESKDFTMNAYDQVCEKGEPLSGRRASELVEQGVLFLKPEIVSRFLQNNLDESIVETIKGETALTLKDLGLKDQALSVKGDQIYEQDQPIDLERAVELIREKKIVRVKSMITSVVDVDFKSPQLQKDMTDAHLFDLLTGQLDRHAGNFIYEKRDDGWHAKLIDNDLSFPKKLDHIDNSSVSVLARSPIPKLLPRLVSRITAEKIASLTPEDMEQPLRASGLSEEEISATTKRLEALQVYLKELPDNGGQLVDQWNHQTYQELMKEENNYIYQGQKSQNLAKESMEAAELMKQ